MKEERVSASPAGLVLQCPLCAGEIALTAERCDCRGCGASFPMLLGIPDLRVPARTWISYEDDRELARRLAARYDSSGFADLVAEIWRERPNADPALVARRIQEILRATGEHREELSASGWIGARLESSGLRAVLDVGCGTGAFLEAALSTFPVAAGVDVSLAWLVTARKRLDERGIAALLFCACVERLPFRSGGFDLTACFDLLEHVHDRAEVAGELARVTRSGGLLVATTPNRFSLSAEPHVGVWGVGLLPRRWMPAYVRWRRGLDFRHVSPLSLSDVAKVFAERFDCDVEAPLIPRANLAAFSPVKRLFARLYNLFLGVSLFRAGLKPVAPFFHIVARKRAGAGEPGTPARR
ncbi:MAG: methyltransferase domain-containing protein [Acidobacteriota bacterium]|nr:methyltransferase domain-containing protein [Acidobacteriota bacterium]